MGDAVQQTEKLNVNESGSRDLFTQADQTASHSLLVLCLCSVTPAGWRNRCTDMYLLNGKFRSRSGICTYVDGFCLIKTCSVNLDKATYTVILCKICNLFILISLISLFCTEQKKLLATDIYFIF